MSWVSLIIAAIKAYFGIKSDIAEQKAEKVGATEQASKDMGAAYDDLAKAADARADADTARILRQPDAGKADPNAAKDFPGVEFRD